MASMPEAFRPLTAAELGLAEEITLRVSVAAGFRDEVTSTHARRLSRYVELLARLAGLPPERCDLLRAAVPLYDLGKVGIPDVILLKPGRHTLEESEIMRQHAEIGQRILGGSTSPLLELAALVAFTHHERWDGTGYPRGLAGEAIPVEGRVVAVADAFNAITSKRVYKAAFSPAKAAELLSDERGRQFDPRLLDLFLGAMAEVGAIRETHSDPE